MLIKTGTFHDREGIEEAWTYIGKRHDNGHIQVDLYRGVTTHGSPLWDIWWRYDLGWKGIEGGLSPERYAEFIDALAR